MRFHVSSELIIIVYLLSTASFMKAIRSTARTGAAEKRVGGICGI